VGSVVGPSQSSDDGGLRIRHCGRADDSRGLPMKPRGTKPASILEATTLGTGASCRDKCLHSHPSAEKGAPGQLELDQVAVAALREFLELLDRWDRKQGDYRGENEL